MGLLLAAYREPLRYQKRLKGPLAEPFQKILQLAAGKASLEIQSLGSQWKSNPEELRKAAIFYIEQFCLDGKEDPYRILGLSPGADFHKIRAHYHLLMLLFHPDRAEASLSWRDAYAVRVNGAYRRLRNPGGRQAYEVKASKTGKRNLAPTYSYRREQKKRNFLLYLVQRFPRSICYLPQFILGSGIVITVVLMADLYLTRTTEDRAKAPFQAEKKALLQEPSSLEAETIKPEDPSPRSPRESVLSPLKKAETVFKKTQSLRKEASSVEQKRADTPLAAPQPPAEKKPPPKSSPDQALAAKSLPASQNFASDKAFSPVPRAVTQKSRFSSPKREPKAKPSVTVKSSTGKAASSTLSGAAPGQPAKSQCYRRLLRLFSCKHFSSVLSALTKRVI